MHQESRITLKAVGCFETIVFVAARGGNNSLQKAGIHEYNKDRP